MFHTMCDKFLFTFEDDLCYNNYFYFGIDFFRTFKLRLPSK